MITSLSRQDSNHSAPVTVKLVTGHSQVGHRLQRRFFFLLFFFLALPPPDFEGCCGGDCVEVLATPACRCQHTSLDRDLLGH